MTHSLSSLDLVVLFAYLAGTTALGVVFGRRQRSAADYFVAERAIPWWAVLLSIVATETSALTFISVPGLAYVGNLGFLEVAFGYLVGRIVVARTLLPRYFAGHLVTAYAFLQTRFGLGARRFASIIFMTTRALADSVRVFATAIPVALILGGVIPSRFVMPAAILILGSLTIVYTYRGGMRAVVWTEILQATVYLVSAAAAIVLIGRLATGGWPAILASAGGAGKLQVLDFSTSMTKPHTVLAGILGGGFLSMASHGTDQLIVQRLLSSRSLKEAQLAIIGSGVAIIIQFALFLTIGVGLWSIYGSRQFANPDVVFPTFIIDHMPPGLLGLVLAAILAATMSTHSAAINSLAAAATHDIYLPLVRRKPDDRQVLRVGKLFALFWGIVLTAGALLFPQNSSTPIVVVALSIASFTYGGLLGGFMLGIFWPRARQRDAIAGMSVGVAGMAIVVFAKPLGAAAPAFAAVLNPLASIAWPWYVLIGTVLTFLVGAVSSVLPAAPDEHVSHAEYA